MTKFRLAVPWKIIAGKRAQVEIIRYPCCAEVWIGQISKYMRMISFLSNVIWICLFTTIWLILDIDYCLFSYLVFCVAIIILQMLPSYVELQEHQARYYPPSCCNISSPSIARCFDKSKQQHTISIFRFVSCQ